MAGYQKTTHPSDPGKKEPAASETQADAGKDDACRCKETAEMSPRQLLKRMVDDLASWIRSNKG